MLLSGTLLKTEDKPATQSCGKKRQAVDEMNEEIRLLVLPVDVANVRPNTYLKRGCGGKIKGP